jgi:hypothetical protein
MITPQKKEYMREYRIKNAERIKISKRAWRIRNRDKVILAKRGYYQRNNKKILMQNKDYYEHNKIDILKKEKESRKLNSLLYKNRKKVYYQKNKQRILEKTKEYFQNNKKLIIQKKSLYHKLRRKNDRIFNIKERLRSRLNSALTTYVKNGKTKTSDEYGINYEELVKNLIETFPADWNERNKWHIDHIIPLNEIRKIKQQNIPFAVKLLFSKENLQWMIGEKNNNKSNKIPTNLSPQSKQILEQINSLK